MFLRFVRLDVRAGSEADFQRFHRERVLPALQRVAGCLFAGLLAPWRGEAHRSVTLWRSADDARAYEDSGLYRELLRESEPMLSERTVWRVRLSEDPLETLGPPERDIRPDGYRLDVGTPPDRLADLPRAAHVRMVAATVRQDRRDEFLALYRDAVLPALQEAPGCLGAFLAEGGRDPDEALSITLWEREEDAVRYELSGEFDRLTRRLQSSFAPRVGWRLTLGEGEPERRTAPRVTSFQLAHGRRLDSQSDPS
jgi:heme-degrading monooxygenase HmoA